MTAVEVLLALIATVVIAGVIYGNWLLGRPKSEQDDRLDRVDREITAAAERRTR